MRTFTELARTPLDRGLEQHKAKTALVTRRKADLTARDRREFDAIFLERATGGAECIKDREGRVGRLTAPQFRERLKGCEVTRK